MFLLNPEVVSALAFGIAVLVSAFVLKGSRVAWGIASISAGGQVVEAISANRSLWLGILNLAVLVCLLVPSSIRFLWGREQSGEKSEEFGLGKAWQAVQGFLYRSLTIAAGWETSFDGESPSRPSKSYRTLIVRLGLAAVLMLLLIGLTYNWQQETGNDVVPNLIADIVWTSWAVIQVSFVVVVFLALFRHVTSSRSDMQRRKVET